LCIQLTCHVSFLKIGARLNSVVGPSGLPLGKLFLSFGLSLSALLAQGGPLPSVLRAEAPIRTLGRVKPGVKVTQVFQVVNEGADVLNLLELHPECGCLTAVASRSRLAPGEAAEIFVTFEPPPQEGPVRKVLAVLTDAAVNPRTELTLTADVEADFRLSANLVTFDQIARTGGGLAEVRLEARYGGAAQVTGWRTSAPSYLTVQPSRAGQDVILHLRLDGAHLPRAAQAGEEWVDLQAANPEAATLRIKVLWTAQPFVAEAHKP
jgi:hypothetical protein